MPLKVYSSTVFIEVFMVALFLIVQNQNKNKEPSKTDKLLYSYNEKLYSNGKEYVTFTCKIIKFRHNI